MKQPAIWITGVGAATPLGCSYGVIAERLLAGQSGVARVTAFDVHDHPAQIAAMTGAIPCPPGWDERDFQTLHRVDQLALWCGVNALRDAGRWEQRSDLRIGVVLGCAAEWHTLWEDDSAAGGRQIHEPQAHLQSITQRTAQRLNLSGPVACLSAACASGNHALALARRWLQLGWVDVCLAGACDLAVTPLTLAAFGNLRALSRRNDEPQRASRPFDVERDGFVMGDGGVLFVLERADDARRRGAPVRAGLAGCGSSSDAYHMVIPSPDPAYAILAIRRALADAGLDPTDIDYINAHATGTPVGDQAEAKALQTVFGAHIDQLPVSSTKGTTGHLLTAAAALEALACIVALERQTVPPTINLERPDPECRLRHVANHAQSHRLRAVASNSFGFGGSNTCVIFRAV